MYSSVNFSLDGKRITVQWRKVTAKGKVFALCVFIDGTLNPAWGLKSAVQFDPFTEKVWRKRTRKIGLKQERAGRAIIENARSKKKKAIIEETLAPYMKVTVMVSYDPTFSTKEALIRQYKKIEGLQFIN